MSTSSMGRGHRPFSSASTSQERIQPQPPSSTRSIRIRPKSGVRSTHSRASSTNVSEYCAASDVIVPQKASSECLPVQYRHSRNKGQSKCSSIDNTYRPVSAFEFSQSGGRIREQTSKEMLVELYLLWQEQLAKSFRREAAPKDEQLVDPKENLNQNSKTSGKTADRFRKAVTVLKVTKRLQEKGEIYRSSANKGAGMRTNRDDAHVLTRTTSSILIRQKSSTSLLTRQKSFPHR